MVSNPQNVDLLIITDSDGIKCEKHNDKIIEFYCKDCKGLICSKCMLSLHYGHQLCLVEDSIGVLIKEMSDLEQYYDKHIGKEYTNSQRNDKLYANMIKQLEQLKLIQINYIRQGFEKI